MKIKARSDSMMSWVPLEILFLVFNDILLCVCVCFSFFATQRVMNSVGGYRMIKDAAGGSGTPSLTGPSHSHTRKAEMDVCFGMMHAPKPPPGGPPGQVCQEIISQGDGLLTAPSELLPELFERLLGNLKQVSVFKCPDSSDHLTFMFVKL